jgi:carboxylesterase type B
MVYGPGNLLDKDVIFVSMNYRLGVFGFLTLGDESLPGNLGMISVLVSCIYVLKKLDTKY